MTLCARCFVRGSYKVGVSSSDFRRVEISDEVKTDWTDKETLHLLEAVMHYHDDWKRVAEHVGGRSARECVAHFVKLPFGEQFIGPPDSSLVDDKIHQPNGESSTEFGLRSTTVTPSKRMRLTPLADASNPIMAQVKNITVLFCIQKVEWNMQRNLNQSTTNGFRQKLEPTSIFDSPVCHRPGLKFLVSELPNTKVHNMLVILIS